jgi:hypothetical protein
MARFGAPFYAPLTYVGIMLVGVGLVWSSARSVSPLAPLPLAPGTLHR